MFPKVHPRGAQQPHCPAQGCRVQKTLIPSLAAGYNWVWKWYSTLLAPKGFASGKIMFLWGRTPSSLLGEQLTHCCCWVGPGNFGTSSCPKSIPFQSKSNSGCFLPIVFLACEEQRHFQTEIFPLNANEYWVLQTASQKVQHTGLS